MLDIGFFFLILCVILCFFNTGYWCFLLSRVGRSPSTSSVDKGIIHSTGLLICNKNGHDLLDSQVSKENFPHDLDEIIIVDDFSDPPLSISDQGVYPNLRVLRNDRDIPGKKAALIHGIQHASAEHLLLTDIDCYPREKWANILFDHLQDHDVVIGYSPYLKRPGVLNSWIRFETFITAIQYFGFALSGKAYMGVGRNLAIKRSAFEPITLSDLHAETASGDDDFLVQYAQNVGVCILQDGFVDSIPNDTFSGYYNQKKRHYSASKQYPTSIKILLGLLSVSHFLFWLSLLIIGVLGMAKVLIFCLITRLVLWVVVCRKAANLLEVKDLIWLFPLFDLILALYYLVFGLSLIFKSSKQW